MKKVLPILTAVVAVFFLVRVIPISAEDPTVISNLSFSPDLDISYFDDYTFSADISPQPASATLTLDETSGGSPAAFHYCVNGTDMSDSDTYNMIFDSGTTWKKTQIRPDSIYPSIAFSPSSVTWGNSPSNTNIRRQNYQILHFTNPFTMASDMNFWIEINASPVSPINSADLLVYLVKKNTNVSFFNSDWRNNSTDIELVGTINRNAIVNHTHSSNSSHYLVRLTANPDKTIGANSLDISGDFWLVLYDTSPNTNRGWNLRYQTSSTCPASASWYTGNVTGWTVTSQSGYPDVHVHFARRSAPIDGLTATVTAGGQSASTDLSFENLPNLPPNSTTFINPVAGVYSNTLNVSWEEATDPNSADTVTYNLYLVDSNANESPLASDLGSPSYTWNTESPLVADGQYTLRGEACDASLCTSFYSQSFSVNNTVTNIYSLSSITMISNNSNTARAQAGDRVTLSFTASGVINSPTVTFYSGGGSVANSATVTNTSGNNWTASYLVSSSDTTGQVTFTISSSNLDLEYSEVTEGSYVTIYTPSPELISSDSGNNTQECTAGIPIGKPDLFQIDYNSTEAILYYAPVSGEISDYYISFSEKSGSLEHGVSTKQGKSTGVLSYKINYLKSNTTYYFRIRAHNDCVPGEWSNEMKITTRRSGEEEFIKNYKNVLVKISRLVSKLTTKNTGSSNNKESGKETVSTTSSAELITTSTSQVKKRCFLWWCW